MKKKVDPRDYNLSPKTNLLRNDSGEFCIVINRKTRIAMKDAAVILQKAKTIKRKVPGASVVLETTAPVCSKSVHFLQMHHIVVVSIDSIEGQN